jgi:hypothetical protein
MVRQVRQIVVDDVSDTAAHRACTLSPPAGVEGLALGVPEEDNVAANPAVVERREANRGNCPHGRDTHLMG